MKWIFVLVLMMIAPAAIADPVSVTFTWTATGDDGNIGTAAGYELRMSSQPITDINWSQAINITTISSKIPLIAGSPESFSTILDLISETTYHFALKAQDEAGNWSFVSNDKVYTSPDTVPPGVIIDLNVQTSN